jgi:hypothetical protein
MIRNSFVISLIPHYKIAGYLLRRTAGREGQFLPADFGGFPAGLNRQFSGRRFISAKPRR